MNIGTIHFFKSLIAQGAIALIFFYRLVDLKILLKGRLALAGLLVFLSVASIGGYFNFGYFPKFDSFMNPHDFFHYYLGSKYSEEVGYFDIYRCVLIADSETGGLYRHKKIRNMNDYSWTPVEQVYNNQKKYKALFSEQRWKEFQGDVKYFKEKLGHHRFQSTLKDKGYNATPVWNTVANFITNHISTSNKAGMNFLISLDLILLSIMLMSVYFAFGWRTALFILILVGTGFPMAFTHIRGAFLRLDWVTMIVIGISMIKLGRYKTAGALMAYAAMARIFPIVFVFGLGVKMIYKLWFTKKIEKEYIFFFASFLAISFILVTSSITTENAIDLWQEFLTKVTLHNSDLSPMRIGFKQIYLGMHSRDIPWGQFESEKVAFFEKTQYFWWAIQFGIITITGFAARKLEDYETVAVCYAIAFFMFSPTFYYQIMMTIPAFLFFPKIEQLSRAIGASILYCISITYFGLLRFFSHSNLTTSYILSWLLATLSLYLLSIALIATTKENTKEKTNNEQTNNAHARAHPPSV